jgi:hypothetical protein
MTSTKRTWMKRLLSTAAMATVAVGLLGAVAPSARADNDDWRWRQNGWHNNNNGNGGYYYRNYSYRPYYRPYYYAPPPAYYYPPPAYYGTPSFGFSFGF